MNNIGGPAPKKLDFISDYKFVIAFENSSFPGYTTEKIFEGMLVNSIPIYWGNPLIHLEFNDKSFINAHQYGSLQEVVDKIIELDQDDNKYKEYLKQPYFKNNQISATLSDEAILDQLTFIIENEKKKKNIFQKKARHLYCLIKYFNDLAKATIKLKYYKYIKYKNIK